MRRSFLSSRTLRVCGLACALFASPAVVAGPDGWQITLDWTPQYCRDNPGSKEVQCGEELYFVLGGLKPVFRDREPECIEGRLPPQLLDDARVDVPNRAKLRRMWARDGACSGLSADEYVLQMGRASRRFAAPPELRRLPPQQRMTAEDIRSAFVRVNPELRAEHLVPQCRRRYFSATTFCVDAEFKPLPCGPEVESNCADDFPIRSFTARQLRGVE